MKNCKSKSLRISNANFYRTTPPLTEAMRKNSKLFIKLLNKVRVGNIDDDVEKLLKARFIHKSEVNNPTNALQMYAENEPVVEKMKLF